jgi:hypothetical protein
MKQVITIGPGSGTPTFAGEQFYIKYPDPYGGIWHTDAIDATNDDGAMATRVQSALRSLPNGVLDGVKVSMHTSLNPRVCHRFHDGHDHFSSFENYHTGHKKDSKWTSNWCKVETTNQLGVSASNMDFVVEFADASGQSGVQYLFEVDITPRGPGSFPMSAGITTANSVVSVAEINYNDNLGFLSESTECSDRGLDDGEGGCECFSGFTGVACETVDSLS